MVEETVTVAELIQALEGFPPDMPVLVHGYERGYVAPLAPVIRSMRANVGTEWYDGPHEEADSDEPADFQAVLLRRPNHHLSDD